MSVDPLTSAIASTIDAIEQIKRAFGAPGDHGYGTPEGDALFALYRSYAALQADPPKVKMPEQELHLATDEEILAAQILAELTRARAKFSGKNMTFAALVEEVGELATATFEGAAGEVRLEAVQVAVMAMRMVLDGDHCFEPWRAEKGLDPLDPKLRALSGGGNG